jgi:hypothetical protein
MNKQDLLNNLNSEEMDSEIKEAVAQKINSYSDELSNSDLKELDSFLAELQVEEAESAVLLEKMAKDVNDLINGMDDNYDEYIASTTQSMKNGLESANTLVSE